MIAAAFNIQMYHRSRVRIITSQNMTFIAERETRECQ